MRIDPAHRVVLIRINRLYRSTMSEHELYEATRKWWVLNPRRDPDYAFSVFRGIVKAAYRIDDWEKNPTSRRWAFQGGRDAVLEREYVGRDISEYFPRGAANPIMYVNC